MFYKYLLKIVTEKIIILRCKKLVDFGLRERVETDKSYLAFMRFSFSIHLLRLRRLLNRVQIQMCWGGKKSVFEWGKNTFSKCYDYINLVVVYERNNHCHSIFECIDFVGCSLQNNCTYILVHSDCHTSSTRSQEF